MGFALPWRIVLLISGVLQRMLFGSKSEKVLRQIEQLEFQLEDLQVAAAIEEAHAASAADRTHQRSPSAVLCPSIFRAKYIRIYPAMRCVPSAVGGCVS